jgi:hypothetical protein
VAAGAVEALLALSARHGGGRAESVALAMGALEDLTQSMPASPTLEHAVRHSGLVQGTLRVALDAQGEREEARARAIATLSSVLQATTDALGASDRAALLQALAAVLRTPGHSAQLRDRALVALSGLSFPASVVGDVARVVLRDVAAILADADWTERDRACYVAQNLGVDRSVRDALRALGVVQHVVREARRHLSTGCLAALLDYAPDPLIRDAYPDIARAARHLSFIPRAYATAILANEAQGRHNHAALLRVAAPDIFVHTLVHAGEVADNFAQHAAAVGMHNLLRAAEHDAATPPTAALFAARIAGAGGVPALQHLARTAQQPHTQAAAADTLRRLSSLLTPSIAP